MSAAFPSRPVENCAACAAYRAGNGNEGFCHRRPPIPLFFGMQRHPLDPKMQAPVTQSFWPQVHGKESYCYEGIPKIAN